MHVCMQADPSKFVSGGADFKTKIAKDKRDVHKPPLNQSWTAATHDSYYPKD